MTTQDLLTINIKFLRYWGCYPLEKSTAFIIKLFYELYILFILLLFFWLFFGSIVEAKEKFESNTSINNYALNIVNVGAYHCGIQSVFFCIVTGKQAMRLIKEVEDSFKYQTESIIEMKSMKGFQNFNRKFAQTFTALLVFSTITFSFIPLFGNRAKLTLPVTEWPLQNVQDSYIFGIAYFLQIIAQVVVGGLCSAVDAYFVSIVLLLGKEFEIVGYDLKNCVYSTLLEYGISKSRLANFIKYSSFEMEHDRFIYDIMLSKNFDHLLRTRFVSHIQYHQQLLKFADKLEAHFWSLLLMKTMTSIFYHVFISFTLVTARDSSLAITMGQYELCAISELLLFAIAGQYLMTKSEDIIDLIYQSPWNNCSKNYATLLRMAMMRAHFVAKISIGKLADMSFPVFVSIMRRAASYFAVLRQISRENDI